MRLDQGMPDLSSNLSPFKNIIRTKMLIVMLEAQMGSSHLDLRIHFVNALNVKRGVLCWTSVEDLNMFVSPWCFKTHGHIFCFMT